MSERSGVEIDYCPQCRGVWLDRGELDKIIDRVASQSPAQQASAPRPPVPPTPAPGMAPPPLYDNFDPRYGDQRGKPRYDDRYSGDRNGDRNYGRQGYDRDYDRRKKKKEGWLGDLFDF